MSARQRSIAKIGAFIWIPALVVMVLPLVLSDPQGDGEAPGWAVAVSLVGFAAFFVSYAAIVLMIKHVFTQSGLPDRWQLGWTTLLLVFNVFAAAVYWHRHMADDQTAENDDSVGETR